MAALKQRKIDGERRVFRDKRTDQHVSMSTEKPTFVVSFIYMCAIIWPPAPFKSCCLARNLKEVTRAWV